MEQCKVSVAAVAIIKEQKVVKDVSEMTRLFYSKDRRVREKKRDSDQMQAVRSETDAALRE